jgi:hypothetical protein
MTTRTEVDRDIQPTPASSRRARSKTPRRTCKPGGHYSPQCVPVAARWRPDSSDPLRSGIQGVTAHDLRIESTAGKTNPLRPVMPKQLAQKRDGQVRQRHAMRASPPAGSRPPSKSAAAMRSVCANSRTRSFATSTNLAKFQRSRVATRSYDTGRLDTAGPAPPPGRCLPRKANPSRQLDAE